MKPLNIDTVPAEGCGFIYILSNPAMPNHYKVGLTTNSIKQRICELNTTGVPKSFFAENIFEIKSNKLREVERLAHQKLKEKDLHAGKEFFEGALTDCIEAVEDAIFEVTGITREELIGNARLRADVESKKLEKERLKIERVRLLEYQRKLKLDELNQQVYMDRQKYIREAIHEQPGSAADRYFWLPLGIVVVAGLVYIFGPLVIVFIVIVFWLEQNRKSKHVKFIRELAERKFPYVKVDDIHVDFDDINKVDGLGANELDVSSDGKELNDPDIFKRPCPRCRQYTLRKVAEKSGKCLYCDAKLSYSDSWKIE